MICNVLSLDGLSPRETEDHTGIIFKMPDETVSFTRSLIGLNDERSFKIKKGEGILLKKYRSVRIPLKLVIGLKEDEHLYYEDSPNTGLTLIGKKSYTGTFDSELYVTVANLTNKPVMIPFGSDLVEGSIYKVSKVTRKNISGVNIFSGWSVPSFLDKCNEIDK